MDMVFWHEREFSQLGDLCPMLKLIIISRNLSDMILKSSVCAFPPIFHPQHVEAFFLNNAPVMSIHVIIFIVNQP